MSNVYDLGLWAEIEYKIIIKVVFFTLQWALYIEILTYIYHRFSSMFGGGGGCEEFSAATWNVTIRCH